MVLQMIVLEAAIVDIVVFVRVLMHHRAENGTSKVVFHGLIVFDVVTVAHVEVILGDLMVRLCSVLVFRVIIVLKKGQIGFRTGCRRFIFCCIDDCLVHLGHTNILSVKRSDIIWRAD